MLKPVTFAALLIFGACIDQVFAQAQVRVAAVVRAPIIEELPLSGTITSPRYSDLTTQVSGLVTAVRADRGDRVQQGDSLLLLDDRTARLSLQRLQARLEELRLSFEDAQRLADEGRRLIEDRNISRTQYESRLAAEGVAMARLKQLEAEIGMQRLVVDRHELKAPFAGVIGFRQAEVGEWLVAGNPALQLVQLDPVRIQANVPERYYAEVGPGTPVRISIDALPGSTIEAQVDTLVSSAEINTRSFTARLDLPNPDARLAPGMSAHLLFLLRSAAGKGVLQVPSDAVVYSSDGSAAVWLVRDGQVHAITVMPGRRSGQALEVTAAGLQEGDLVVTLGNESLRPGQQVSFSSD